MPDPVLTIAHEGDALLAHLDGEQVGRLAYRRQGAVVDAYTTYVEPAARRHGVALKLVQALVDWVRAEELTVRPTCWYVAKVMQADPGMRVLVAG
jgi:predicted GNAT family acetyltransferase